MNREVLPRETHCHAAVQSHGGFDCPLSEAAKKLALRDHARDSMAANQDDYSHSSDIVRQIEGSVAPAAKLN